jgi:menaquinone-dependent protoporphyrinogen oxidase
MARVLVVFGTTDGQTAKIAQTLGGRLSAAGHDVSVVDPAAAPADISAYDAIIVAASVHAGGYQRNVARWVRTHARGLDGKPNAFVSVCLGVLQQDPKVNQDLQGILDGFSHTTGWRPSETKIVAGALKYTRYNLLKRWIMKRIAAKAGGDTDTSRDYEYTNWADLQQFADSFGARVGTTRLRMPA